MVFIMLFSSSIGQETGADDQPITDFLTGWDVVSVVTVWVWATALICVSAGMHDPNQLNQTQTETLCVCVNTVNSDTAVISVCVMSYTDNQQGKCMSVLGHLVRMFHLWMLN